MLLTSRQGVGLAADTPLIHNIALTIPWHLRTYTLPKSLKNKTKRAFSYSKPWLVINHNAPEKCPHMGVFQRTPCESGSWMLSLSLFVEGSEWVQNLAWRWVEAKAKQADLRIRYLGMLITDLIPVTRHMTRNIFREKGSSWLHHGGKTQWRGSSEL